MLHTQSRDAQKELIELSLAADAPLAVVHVPRDDVVFLKNT